MIIVVSVLLSLHFWSLFLVHHFCFSYHKTFLSFSFRSFVCFFLEQKTTFLFPNVVSSILTTFQIHFLFFVSFSFSFFFLRVFFILFVYLSNFSLLYGFLFFFSLPFFSLLFITLILLLLLFDRFFFFCSTSLSLIRYLLFFSTPFLIYLCSSRSPFSSISCFIPLFFCLFSLFCFLISFFVLLYLILLYFLLFLFLSFSYFWICITFSLSSSPFS